MHEIMEYYCNLPAERKRFVAAWAPVVLLVTQGFVSFPDESFTRHIPYFYKCFTSLLKIPISAEQQQCLQHIFERVGGIYEVSVEAPGWEMTHGSLSDIIGGNAKGEDQQ
jgi:hypothetical protein